MPTAGRNGQGGQSLYVQAIFKKNCGYRWKRCRHSLKSLRSESDFRQEQEDQTRLQQQAAQGEVKIYYFDGSGFSTASSIPYAWQAAGETREIPRKRSKRLNVLGFMSRDNDSFFHTVEGGVNSARVIEAFDGFAARYAQQYEQTRVPCIVILDNASVHRSGAVKQRINDWMQQGVFLHFLPPYSPELNSIEILWRKVKYEWLPIASYANYHSMKEAVLGILQNFGKKYRITFA